MDRSTKVLRFSLGFLAFGALFGFIGFPMMFKYLVKDQTALRRRNLMRGYYLKLPIPLTFKVYFFNISNPNEVMKGKKPVLKEIGPYVYDTYKEKIEVIDNDAEDSLSYTPYETYFYNQEKSGSLTENDYVTMIDPVVVGAINYVFENNMQSLLPVVMKAIKLLRSSAESIYFTVKVRDILFDGILIDCTHKEYPVKALCPQLKNLLKELAWEKQTNKVYFSFLGNRNGTLPKRFKVLRGIKRSKDVGRLIEYNDQNKIQVWNSKKCNRFKGTDGWIFPPFLTKEEGIWTFSHDLCRNIQAKYVGQEDYNGIDTRKYYALLGDMTNNPEDKCYCLTRDTCLPRGLLDLSKCMGVPIYASLPHLLDVPSSVANKVKGLKPDMDQHAVKILFEYMTGVPLKAAKRMQFNLPIQPRSQVEFMKQLPEALHPIIWVEESVELEGTLFYEIYAVVMLVKIMDYAKYFLTGLGLIGVGIGGVLKFRERQLHKVTPIHSKFSSTKTLNTDDNSSTGGGNDNNSETNEKDEKIENNEKNDKDLNENVKEEKVDVEKIESIVL